MRKLAVIFPGIGYHADKPLLYYAKKIARQHDYEVVEIRFPEGCFQGIDKRALQDRKTMLQAFSIASEEAEKQLRAVDFSDREDIIFISKSIGTVAASVYAARNRIPVRQVYFTPLEQTFSLVSDDGFGAEKGLVFFGLQDPFIQVDTIEKRCVDKKMNYRKIEGANHSLETGDLRTDLWNIADIIEETENFLVGSPIYRLPVLRADGSLTDLSEYRGKVMLIFNSATGCGFTPQYEALENMYRKYHKDGLEILDFPCDQFGHQAPGTDEEIHAFCTARYDISFPQFKKIEVNGENQTELFAYLKMRQGFGGFLRNSKESLFMEKKAAQADPEYQYNSDIKWNFTKFLVDRKGKVIARFEADAGTEIVEQAVERAL